MKYTILETPVGDVLIAGDDDHLTSVRTRPNRNGRYLDGWSRDDARFENERRQLEEYFAGERTDFDLELEMSGSNFQKKVWEALQEIPYGATRTYGEVAVDIGAPGAARAVGSANSRNPIPIIVPCHRVVAAGGKLGGYSAGLDIKRWLLALESKTQAG